MKIVIVVLVILVGLIAVGWLGLRVRPQPFPPLAQQSPALKTVPLPAGLPAPVERYYRQLYGDQVPVIESAVITGRATMSPVGGLKLPARFRFIHQAGQDYRHFFELTWFGRTIGTGNEHYLDGKSRLALPMGLSDEGPQVDQAANLSLWAEYVWLPAVFLTDPRVRWEPVDEKTALLAVPFGDQFERFVGTLRPGHGPAVYARSHALQGFQEHGQDAVAERIAELGHGGRLSDPHHRRGHLVRPGPAVGGLHRGGYRPQCGCAGASARGS